MQPPIQIVFNCSPGDFHTADDAVSYLTKILTLQPTPTLRVQSTPTTAPAVQKTSPIVQEWLRVEGKTRMRCTSGRSPEEQAIHNLTTYKGYTEDMIATITDVSTVSYHSPKSDDDTPDLIHAKFDPFEVVYDSAEEEDVDHASLV